MGRLLMRSSAWLITLLVSLALVFISIPTVLADTSGQELQTGQPDKLVIQLGVEWAGTEFELKTDVGLYPQPIVVSPEGMLSLELGGSKTYTLSALSSGQLVSTQQPDTDTPGEPASPSGTPTGQPLDTDAPESQATVDDTTETDMPGQASESGEDKNLINGIPNLHLFLFAGGIILCVTGLIVMRVIKTRGNRREADIDDYDDDDY